MFRLDDCVLQAHTLQALWQREQENKAHVLRWSWNSVSSVGHIHILKDEAHSAWNVHLSQHNHVSAIERNSEHDDVMSKGHDALSHLLQVTVIFTLLRAPRRQSTAQPSWQLREDPLKQSPLEGAIHFTNPGICRHEGCKGHSGWWGTLRWYGEAALRLQWYPIQENKSNTQNTALHQHSYLSSSFVFCHFKN